MYADITWQLILITQFDTHLCKCCNSLYNRSWHALYSFDKRIHYSTWPRWSSYNQLNTFVSCIVFLLCVYQKCLTKIWH